MSGEIETLRQNIAALNVTSPTGAEVASEIRGDYRGEKVVTSSQASKVQDAAEELGMSVAHRANKLTLNRREVRQGQGASLEALARIADYYDKLPDMPREAELRQLVETLQDFQQIVERAGQDGHGVSKDDILAALQEFDPDVTHQYAALDIAREFFTAAGADDAFHALLDEAYDEFNKGDLAREVRAGFAAAEPASQIAATLETDPAAVRESYRALLRETKNMGQLFDTFRGFDVMKNFEAVIETFMAAAGHDLASTGPSTDPAYLHALVTELARLKKMQSVVDMSSQLIQTTDRLLAAGEQPQGEAADVASSIFNFASNPSAGAKDARDMLGRYQRCSLATQVVFANGLRVLHAELPDNVAPTPQARLLQNAAVMAMLDSLVADEEREYQAHDEDEEGGYDAGGHESDRVRDASTH